MSYFYDVPGLGFRFTCSKLALNLLWARDASIPYADIYRMIFWPMQSTRYFEFDFVWNGLVKTTPIRYLDVSSPQIFPLILLSKQRHIFAELLNPDATDLRSTAKLVSALNLSHRCNLHKSVISAAPFESASFDTISSISVVEHIPHDSEAIQQMWDLLKPKGRLLLTLPCAARTVEQYSDRNEYGLLTPDERGRFFFQRLYDQQLLEERIFSITGRPRRYAVYGEKCLGTHRRILDQKILDRSYPYWREPYTMAKGFGYFRDVGDLPGEGVIGLEFEKK